MGEGFGETVWGLQRHFSPPAPTFVIISDYEEEEQVEKKTTEVEDEGDNLLKLSNQQIFHQHRLKEDSLM